MSLRFVLPVLTAVAAFVPTSGQAQEYPWCAHYSENAGGAISCGFVSRQQCMATVSGIHGICYQNPAYSGRPATKSRKRR